MTFPRDVSTHSKVSEMIIDLTGGIASAVDVLVDLDRSLWQRACRASGNHRLLSVPASWIIDGLCDSALSDIAPLIASIVSQIDHPFESSATSGENDRGYAEVTVRNLLRRPYSIATFVLSAYKHHDIRFFSSRNIRRRYGSADIQSALAPCRLLATALNAWRDSQKSVRHSHIDIANLYELCHNALAASGSRGDAVNDNLIGLFLEACRTVGYIIPGFRSLPDVRIETLRVDVEYMLCQLFGCPTGIAGFDELFGGGGLLLADSLEPSTGRASPGRAILIKGRFGTGKSILALQLCAEVARKGGLARYVALEQSPMDCKYILESMGAFDGAARTDVTISPFEFASRLSKWDGKRGLLAILDGVKDSHQEFLAGLNSDAADLGAVGLRMIAVDPINSVHRNISQTPVTELRNEFFDTVARLKRNGVNVLFVAEESTDTANETLFEENVVDTVIHLAEEQAHGYSRRFLRVQKSRLQREHRGLHSYSIHSGEGIHIYPSSAAVDARLLHRRIVAPSLENSIAFGLDGLDRIVGDKALLRGDVIAFAGPTGSFKTQLGLVFLLNSDLSEKDRGNRRTKSLLISAREPAGSLRFQLRSAWVRQYISNLRDSGNGASSKSMLKGSDDIIIDSLPIGYIHPGFVLQSIAAHFEHAHANGYIIDRVMISNIAHWELACPFIREDRTFSDTLVNMLRRHSVSSLFVCGDVSQAAVAEIQKPILDDADVVVVFEKYDFQGERRVLLRATKTRRMEHLRQRFEVGIFDDALQVRKTSALLRSDATGGLQIVPVRLFLHAETVAQTAYNNRWVEAIKAVVSTDARVEAQPAVYAGGALRLTHASALDELQIFQIDEFQLPRDNMRQVANKQSNKDAGAEQECVVRLDPSMLPDVFRQGKRFPFLFSLSRGLSGDRGEYWNALPYHADFGVLVVRKDLVDADKDYSWEQIADLSDSWSKEHSSADEIFFDFPRATPENYNCLFLEMLGAHKGSTKIVGEDVRQFFLSKSEALLHTLRLFWRLGRPAYLRSCVDRPQPPPRSRPRAVDRETENAPFPFEVSNEWNSESWPVVNDQAVVWRHWLSSAQQMVAMSAENIRSHMVVRSLPRGMCVGGEWLLCIPGHSSGIDVGYDILNHALSAQSELERARLGIGLPVQNDFYYRIDKNGGAREIEGKMIFGDMVLDRSFVLSQIDRAFKRSSIPGYRMWSNSLASGLKSILRIPDSQDDLWTSQVNDIVQAVASVMSAERPRANKSRKQDV